MATVFAWFIWGIWLTWATASDSRKGSDSATCTSHQYCGYDEYCDSAHNCYDCDFVRSNNEYCDAFDGDCSVCGIYYLRGSSHLAVPVCCARPCE